VAFGAAILFFLERTVLRRISLLSREVGQIHTTGDLSARVSQLGEDEVARLAGTINTMIAALNNSQQALRQSEERARQEALRLEGLRQVGLELAAQLDLEALLRSIVARAIHLLDADDGGLYLYRSDRDVLERVVSVDDTIPLGSILRRGEGLSGKVWETGEPLIVDDYQHWEGKASIFRDKPNMAIVGVPVRWGDRLLGILNVAARGTRRFTADDAELLNLLATQAAVALENARLFAAARQRTAELETLRQASLRLTAQLELQSVLEAILESALKLAAADDAHVFLYDGRQLTFGAALWADGRTEQPHSLPRPGGLTFTVARTGERLVIPYVDEHPLFKDWQWGGAIVGLPLSIGQRVLGVMNVALNRPHDFDEGELRVLGLMADQAAIAIENARLYTDLQERIEQLKRTQAQLIQSARLVAVGELAAGVAHQLNNSLTPILGYAELLAENLGADSPYQEDLQRIITKGHQASEIVRNLLDFARQMKPQKEMVHINDVVRKTLALIRVQLEKAGLTVEEDYADGLDLLPMDAGQIGQVLLNLVNNAAQAMPSGGTLRLRTYWKGSEVAIAISDTGPGLSPDAQAHLFEPFFTTKPGRIGLGLSVSLGIVQEHGGHIEVASSPGQGCTFTVWLPLPERAGASKDGSD
jgi:signal transduction histidine kinase